MKVTKNTIPKDFNLALALFDAISVIIFSISIYLLTTCFNSILFKIGSMIMISSGMMKVLWKIIIALNKKNIYFFYFQMKYLMPIGFSIVVLGLIINHSNMNVKIILDHIIAFPACICYLLFVTGMSIMGILGKKLDSSDVKSNWIEQGVNTVAQACLLIGLLLCL